MPGKMGGEVGHAPAFEIRDDRYRFPRILLGEGDAADLEQAGIARLGTQQVGGPLLDAMLQRRVEIEQLGAAALQRLAQRLQFLAADQKRAGEADRGRREQKPQQAGKVG